MRLGLAALAFTLALSACETSGGGVFGPEHGPAPPLPMSGPILYNCADGTQLQVTFQQNDALVSVIGGVSMALPHAGADYYSNGRYAIRGRGPATSWEVGRAAPVACAGR